MTLQAKAKRVHQSYIRAGGRTLVSAFYDRLMMASEEIRQKFEHVDMETQTDILAHAIVMSFLFVDKGQLSARRCLDGVRESHDRHHLDIQPQLYDTWLNCLIETASACDPEANDALMDDWREVMSIAVEHVRNGY